MLSILVHIANSEPVKLDVEELPDASAQYVMGKNPRERNDREVEWIDEGVNTILIPWWRINYIQVLSSGDRGHDFPLPFRD